MKVVERIKEYDAVQLDGTESCARAIVEWAYSRTSPHFRYSLEPNTIKWINNGDKSYFTVVIAVRNGTKPTEEWEAEVGDWIVKDDLGHLKVYTDEKFNQFFKEVDDGQSL